MPVLPVAAVVLRIVAAYWPACSSLVEVVDFAAWLGIVQVKWTRPCLAACSSSFLRSALELVVASYEPAVVITVADGFDTLECSWFAPFVDVGRTLGPFEGAAHRACSVYQAHQRASPSSVQPE